METDTHKGMAIVSLAAGTKLGHVAQPLFALAARRVVAQGADSTSGTFAIPFAQVASIGADALATHSGTGTIGKVL